MYIRWDRGQGQQLPIPQPYGKASHTSNTNGKYNISIDWLSFALSHWFLDSEMSTQSFALLSQTWSLQQLSKQSVVKLNYLLCSNNRWISWLNYQSSWLTSSEPSSISSSHIQVHNTITIIVLLVVLLILRLQVCNNYQLRHHDDFVQVVLWEVVGASHCVSTSSSQIVAGGGKRHTRCY